MNSIYDEDGLACVAGKTGQGRGSAMSALNGMMPERTDLTIGAFLNFLGQDMLRNSQNVVAFPPGFAERMAMLTEHAWIDHDREIEGPVAI